MKITVFTSNQRRHVSLIEGLAAVADAVFAVQEVTTLFPGIVDDFYRKTPVMQRYFQYVMAAEEKLFAPPRFLPGNVRTVSMKMGDLNRLSCDWLAEGLEADLFVILGASFIKPPLVDLLLARDAINIHMGTSPYYRGNSCNFWALYDQNAEYVGATIHRLGRGLDSGPILFHTLPEYAGESSFEYTMKAVKSAQLGLISKIADGSVTKINALMQDKSKQIRYSKNEHFTDEICAEFLSREPSPQILAQQSARRKMDLFTSPFILR